MTDGSKYHPLFEHLLFSGQSVLLMSFSEVESIVGAPLPLSARTREEWWSNSPRGHSQARAWLRASYFASKINLAAETVTFVLRGWAERDGLAKAGPSGPLELKGMAENPQSPYERSSESRRGADHANHPLFGIWKGKVTLVPEHDYAKPAFEDCQ